MLISSLPTCARQTSCCSASGACIGMFATIDRTGFDQPRAVVLCPADLSKHLRRAVHGLGGEYGPYHDLLAVEATRRLIVTHPIWAIPAMNRMLVERINTPRGDRCARC